MSSNLKRNVGGFLAVLVFAMQLLLAQHLAVHFNEGAHTVLHVAGKADTPQEHRDDPCQVCLFSKAMSSTLSAAFVFVPAPLMVTEALAVVRPSFAVYPLPALFSARAPPLFG